MAQSAVAPLIPNVGTLNEAIAGTQATTFTATDRQMIKELAGEINRDRSFKEIFSNKGLLPEVENEETTVKPKQDLKIIEKRQRENKYMLKHVPLATPRERVEISDQDSEAEALRIDSAAETTVAENTAAPLSQATATLIKELNLNPSEMYNKFALEQDQLHSLICRIKELHLKRLLCGSQKEFNALSERIKEETLSSSLPDARPWLEEQLDILTRSAAEYKSKLTESLKKFQ